MEQPELSSSSAEHNSPGYYTSGDASSPSPAEHNSPGYYTSGDASSLSSAEQVGEPTREEDDDRNKEELRKTEFYNYVTLYYDYKQQYKEANEIIKRRIMPTKSNAERRKEYLKKKPQCINCKRHVGTIFATELRTMLTDDDFRRTLIAKCGDKTAPCNLDIQISLPYIVLFDDVISPTTESINNYKSRIIQIKNDVMFGYMTEDEAIKRYTAIGGLLADDTTVLEKTIFERDIATKEQLNQKRLTQTEDLFEKDIEEFARLTNEYRVTSDDQFLKDSAKIYVDHVIKNARLLTDLKYEYCEIEYDDDSNVFTLVQKQFPLNNNQYYSGEEVYETVMKFVKGDSLLKFNKTLKKSKMTSATIAKNKPKTRKQKTRDSRIKLKLSGSSNNEATPASIATPSVNSEISASE